MPRRIPLLLIIFVLPSYVFATELVTNGGFESDLPPAWQVESAGAAASVSRATDHDADPDYEVLAEKGTGNGFAKLNQTVVIPATDVDISLNAKMEATATSGGPWAAAGVALHYENHFGDVLGTTMIVLKTPDCPWVDSSTFHMIPVPDGEWNNYMFNVGGELANLLGVDMMAIHQIRISLFGQIGGDC